MTLVLPTRPSPSRPGATSRPVRSPTIAERSQSQVSPTTMTPTQRRKCRCDLLVKGSTGPIGVQEVAQEQQARQRERRLLGGQSQPEAGRASPASHRSGGPIRCHPPPPGHRPTDSRAPRARRRARRGPRPAPRCWPRPRRGPGARRRAAPATRPAVAPSMRRASREHQDAGYRMEQDVEDVKRMRTAAAQRPVGGERERGEGAVQRLVGPPAGADDLAPGPDVVKQGASHDHEHVVERKVVRRRLGIDGAGHHYDDDDGYEAARPLHLRSVRACGTRWRGRSRALPRPASCCPPRPGART